MQSISSSKQKIFVSCDREKNISLFLVWILAKYTIRLRLLLQRSFLCRTTDLDSFSGLGKAINYTATIDLCPDELIYWSPYYAFYFSNTFHFFCIMWNLWSFCARLAKNEPTPNNWIQKTTFWSTTCKKKYNLWNECVPASGIRARQSKLHTSKECRHKGRCNVWYSKLTGPRFDSCMRWGYFPFTGWRGDCPIFAHHCDTMSFFLVLTVVDTNHCVHIQGNIREVF